MDPLREDAARGRWGLPAPAGAAGAMPGFRGGAGPGAGERGVAGTPGAAAKGRAGMVAVAAALCLGCADTVRPVLGGLKIGAAPTPFQMPVLQNEKVPFEYPREAWERGVGGETVLRIHISPQGTVDSAEVLRSSGQRSLDSAAVAGALRLRYRPAKQGDEPVAVWGILPVRYPMPSETTEQP